MPNIAKQPSPPFAKRNNQFPPLIINTVSNQIIHFKGFRRNQATLTPDVSML
jgi:hypothetical protein